MVYIIMKQKNTIIYFQAKRIFMKILEHVILLDYQMD